MTEVIGEEEALKYKRARRGSIRWRLVRWLNEPLEGDGAYVDTLEPLVQEMLKEQREKCADAVKREGYRKNHVPTIQDYVQACLNAGEKDE